MGLASVCQIDIMPAGKAILYVPFAETVAKQDKFVHEISFYPIVLWFL
jgi:hypothetical protein